MMSLKTSKRKIVCVILILVAVLATVGIFVLNSSKNNVPERIITSHDPEIQRSMTYAEVQPGEDSVVGTEFVKFDAFFARDLTGNGYANKLRGSCREINDNDTLFISLNVLTEGQFENGQITIPMLKLPSKRMALSLGTCLLRLAVLFLPRGTRLPREPSLLATHFSPSLRHFFFS